ncbi:MAG: hypothetical protein Q8R76_05740 [Candidatus Omnitrophota bacterium]|nr:hypothetical protein [Candidatus Omnitrophota bacterium]
MADRSVPWPVWTALTVFLIFGCADDLSAAYRPGTCREALKQKSSSGIARSAKEDSFGKVNLQPPYGSFPADVDKITWWSKYKRRFKEWGHPDLEAAWINPKGEEVARRKFRGEKCRLAETSIRGEDQPDGRFVDGVWVVEVSCGSAVLDRQSFVVHGLTKTLRGTDAPGSDDSEPATIWARDALNE